MDKKLDPVSIRFTSAQIDDIRETAQSTNTSFSFVVRRGVDALYAHGKAAAEKIVANGIEE